MSGNGEYISREVALDAISEWLMKALHSENTSSYNEGERAAYRTAISEIAELPAADVREVVLCKDCKFWECPTAPTHNKHFCDYWESGTYDVDFCSHGEKREG